MRDADYDILNIGAETVAKVARDMATEAMRIRDQHRRQIDAMKLDIADMKAEIARLESRLLDAIKAGRDPDAP